MMNLLKQIPPKMAKQMGIGLFVFSGVALGAALTLPFVTLPVSGAMKAGLITVVAVLSELTFAGSLALVGNTYLNKLKSLVSFPDAALRPFFLATGGAVWFVATVLLRFVGHYLLVPGNPWLTVGVSVGVAVLMIGLMTLLYRIRKVRGQDRQTAALLFTLPGMLLDAGAVLFFRDVFPNMPPNANGLFAAWLFWGYSVVLLTGVFMPEQPHDQHQRT